MQNELYYGDNLAVLRRKIASGSVDLCYIDPPFNSKRNYFQIYTNQGGEDRAQAQAFVDTWNWGGEAVEGLDYILSRLTEAGPDDTRWTEQTVELIRGLEKVLGRGSLLAYLVHMTLRIVEIHRVLKPTGSFYLHCDLTANHYLKLVIDSIFCGQGGEFQSEIVWRRTTAHGNAKQGARRFETNYDTILLYSKSQIVTFNTTYEPFSDEQIKQQYNKTDADGRRYRLVTPTAAKGGGDTSYEFHGVVPPKGRFWAYSRAKMDAFNDEGLLYFSSTGQPYIRYYLDERPGVAVMSFWDDVKPMSPTSKERLGYPTQKPEALLERIIKASSNEGDVVLDAYCGCGTTVAVAQRLGRRWIGIDVTYQSIALILKRFADTYKSNWPAIEANIKLDGVPRDIESAMALANRKDDKTRKEFEKWAVLTFSRNQARINEKKGADGGVDGIAYFFADRDAKGADVLGKAIFQVKSRPGNRGDLATLNSDRQREGAEFGFLICTGPMPVSRAMRDEIAAAGKYKHPLLDREDDRLQVIFVAELFAPHNHRLDLPMARDAVKSAMAKGDADAQMGLL